jgi:RNA polymerase sigma-70 factor (ECF subfamily)
MKASPKEDDAAKRPPPTKVLSQAMAGTDAWRASGGDLRAFDRLVRAQAGLVCGVATRLVGPDDAQDACQEVWVLVWRNIGSFRGDSAFETWLYRVATNACLSYRRKEARRSAREDGLANPDPPAPAAGADPEAAALNSERREELRAALRRVRAEHRAALVLRHAEGFSYAEIAEALGVPDGTAKGWASRGRDAALAALPPEKRGVPAGRGPGAPKAHR